MNDILQTEDLENIILGIISTDIIDFVDSKIKLNVHFEYGNIRSIDGSYVYADNEYHFISVERGTILKEVNTNNLLDIIYISLKSYISELANNYAKANWNKKTDFRRKLFEKELEIYHAMGNQFYEKRLEEIKKILKVS